MKKLVVILLALLVVGAAGAIMYLKTEKGVVLDSASVEAQAAAMWPGAKPPQGLKGVLALRPEEDIQVAILAPSLDKVKPDNLSGSDLRIVVAQPKMEGQPNLDEIKLKIASARQRREAEMKVLNEKPALLTIGGQPYPGIESEATHIESGKNLREELTILMKDQQATVILILGPTDGFNAAARDEFLAGLEAPMSAAGLPDKFKLPEPPAQTELPPKPKPPKRPALPAKPRPELPGPPGLP